MIKLLQEEEEEGVRNLTHNQIENQVSYPHSLAWLGLAWPGLAIGWCYKKENNNSAWQNYKWGVRVVGKEERTKPIG